MTKLGVKDKNKNIFIKTEDNNDFRTLNFNNQIYENEAKIYLKKNYYYNYFNFYSKIGWNHNEIKEYFPLDLNIFNNNKVEDWDLKWFTFEEITINYINHLIKKVYLQNNIIVKNIILNCNNNFSILQKNLLFKEAKLNDINIKFLSNPLALLLGLNLHNLDDKLFLTVSFNHSIFEINIVKLNNNKFEIIDSYYDRKLSFNFLNYKIVNKILEDYDIINNTNYKNDIKIQYKLLYNLNEFYDKSIKSDKLEFWDFKLIDVNSKIKNINFYYDINKKKIENFIEDDINMFKKKINEFLNKNNLSPNNFEKCIIEGRLSNFDFIKNIFSEGYNTIFDNKNDLILKGLINYSDLLKNNFNSVTIINKLNSSIGIRIKGGIFEKLILKNTVLPTKTEFLLTNPLDNQERIKIKLYKGERDLVSHNTLLGELIIDNLEKLKSLKHKLKLIIEIDENYHINVTVHNLLTLKQYNTKIILNNNIENLESERIFQNVKYLNKEKNTVDVIDYLNNWTLKISELELKYSKNTQIMDHINLLKSSLKGRDISKIRELEAKLSNLI